MKQGQQMPKLHLPCSIVINRRGRLSKNKGTSKRFYLFIAGKLFQILTDSVIFCVCKNR